MYKKILVIKHGALGDIFMALGAFKAIRKHHQDAKVILLTTKPFIKLARKMGYFDEVWYDNRSPWWDFKSTIGIYRKLHGNGKVPFDRVYDLQNSTRSRGYYKLLKSPKPEWVGNVHGCSHHHPRDTYKHHHIKDYYNILFKDTGVKNIPNGEISWLKSDIGKYDLGSDDFAIFIPGCSKGNPDKRWSAANFAHINTYLKARNIKAVLIGREDDRDIINDIIEKSGEDQNNLINLINETSLDDLAEIGRRSKFILGGDTGPMHIVSYLEIPIIMFFSGQSLFDLVSPRGQNVTLIHEKSLRDLKADHVIKLINSHTDIR
ncbi:MAG: glycosyltransferase family 9 protein [Rickettsiales bacterium]|jgi:ADP-heptose:LPS heptosyltransferase|nr:glycosyltransferase family 9 protein [Rickettsiales bacterium]